LEYKARPGTTNQQILAVAGALLFREDHVRKKIKVLSGGERARLCLAGLLLGDYNVLVLDEPGNHLDVETVEALAEALFAYRGTVVFTSHDRHFMKRVATTVIEVRDGRARNYGGGYDVYLHAVNKEIDDGEREYNARMASPPPAVTLAAANGQPSQAGRSPRQRDQRKVRKEISNVERKIARLDEQKREVNDRLMQTADAEEALRLHNELTALSEDLSAAEERWCELQEEQEVIE
jgi:ATP-binding cassette subfamily F protein 3